MLHLTKPVTCAVNRARFDQFLAKRAKAAGAKFRLGARVSSLFAEGNIIRGVNVTVAGGAEERIPAGLVVDAEGISSRLVRQAGLQGLKREALLYAVEAEVANVEGIEEHAVEVYVGKDYAPGFYGWLIPRLDGSAKVGIATREGNPKDFLERLMRRHPIASRQFRNAKVKSLGFHAITLGGPIPRAYASGFLAVGDCASQVKPTTGGGVIFGLTCARIAAETAAKALEKNNFSADSLSIYQKRFMEKLVFDVDVMLRVRKAVDSFSDEKIDRAMRFASRMGFDRALKDIDEIDFQGKTLLGVLGKPSAYAMLAYLLALYLPANA